jgi:hypothetical protein
MVVAALLVAGAVAGVSLASPSSSLRTSGEDAPGASDTRASGEDVPGTSDTTRASSAGPEWDGGIPVLPAMLPEGYNGAAPDMGAFESCFGDVNVDGIVDLTDVSLFSRFYNGWSWRQALDLNDDGRIDLSDIGALSPGYNGRCLREGFGGGRFPLGGTVVFGGHQRMRTGE